MVSKTGIYTRLHLIIIRDLYIRSLAALQNDNFENQLSYFQVAGEKVHVHLVGNFLLITDRYTWQAVHGMEWGRKQEDGRLARVLPTWCAYIFSY